MQCLIQQVLQTAFASRKKVITLEWLQSPKGLQAVQDPSMRSLLGMPALAPKLEDKHEDSGSADMSEDEDADEPFVVEAEDDETPGQIAKREGYTIKEVLEANKGHLGKGLVRCPSCLRHSLGFTFTHVLFFFFFRGRIRS